MLFCDSTEYKGYNFENRVIYNPKNHRDILEQNIKIVNITIIIQICNETNC